MFNFQNDDMPPSIYKTLEDIRLRKAQLLTELTKDSSKMNGIWDGLFHSPKEQVTPTSRFTGVVKTGAGMLDGLILGWKLYRKFGKKKKSKKKKLLGIF